MTDLSDRVCVVTGASSGIGRAIALALAQAGARVWALGRDASRLAALAAALSGAPGDIEPLAVDLEVDEQVTSAAATIADGAPGVDVIVHSAGAIFLGTVETLGASEFDQQYRVNLRAPFVLTQALLPELRRARGHLVFLNSTAAVTPAANNLQYAATKAGLKALADGLRSELKDDGVRVTSVYLGRTATPMQARIHEHEGRTYVPEVLMRAEDVADAILALVLLPATTEATDLHMRHTTRLPRS